LRCRPNPSFGERSYVNAVEETWEFAGFSRIQLLGDRTNDAKISRAVEIGWELSTLGHPLSDLAYNCMKLTMRTTDRESFKERAGVCFATEV
jgi:hypothetical protein